MNTYTRVREGERERERENEKEKSTYFSCKRDIVFCHYLHIFNTRLILNIYKYKYKYYIIATRV